MEQHEIEKQVPHRVFVVAGSEPLGSAGLQADIKAIAACGGYGAGALTCVVDEDTLRVREVLPIPAELVVSQIRFFLEDVGADSLKTGMLYSAALVERVAAVLSRYPTVPLVVDPVMVSSGGDPLLEADAVRSYREHLVPRATVITPNRREAELLLGRALNSDAWRDELRELSQNGATAVVVKSAVVGQGQRTDWFYDPSGDQFREFRKPDLPTRNVNGSGDMFASALATYLARGWRLSDAVARAEEFIDQALRHAVPYRFGAGYGPVLPFGEHTLQQQKETLRYRMLRQLREQSPQRRKSASEAVLRHLAADERFRTARVLVLYHSLPSEVDTRLLIERLAAEGREVLLPVSLPDGIRLKRYDPALGWAPGALNIMELVGDYYEAEERIELVVVPGVAFDRSGNRLGRGKGYYDRLLRRLPGACKIGICYPFQLVDEVPLLGHDIRMDRVITDCDRRPVHSPRKGPLPRRRSVQPGTGGGAARTMRARGCGLPGRRRLQQEVEQIAREDDEQCHRPEEDTDQPPGHHLFEERGLGQRESHHSHHEGDGCAERNPLGHEHLDHRHDARGVGVHRYGQQYRQRHGIPVVPRQVVFEESLRHETVHEGAEDDAAGDVQQRHPHPERPEEHGHGHLIDQRRGDEKREGHPQRNPPFTKPMNNGIDEQEQNGVIAPKSDANRYCNP